MKLRSCVILLYVTAVLTDEEWLEVQTLQGPVRGLKHPSEDLYAFYNIPYATAPTGVHKYKPPLPPPIWSEPFDAIEVNFICPQKSLVIKEFLPRGPTMMEENCLTANIFVPKTTDENLSVLVYVHGGGFLIGYGNRNKGTQLMKKKDLIIVTFNYRLGVHGFLCLGTEDIPGNAGMKDQVELLRWVQKNIARFGGNPDDVTLAGSSSGSASVDLIMLSKSAEGLFHRVIPESGGNLAAFAVQRDPVRIAKYYAMKLNFSNVDDIIALEGFYKTLPLNLLTSESLFDRTDFTFLFSPCVESDTGHEAFLTESPYTILQQGSYKKLPMLYGFSSMEGMLRIGHFDIWKHKMYEDFSDFLPADLKFESEKERQEVAQTIKLFYFGKNAIGDDSVLGYLDYFSDVLIAFPMLRAVQLHVEAGHKEIYLYQYSFLSEDLIPHTNMRGNDHCAQSKAWLDNVDGKNESLENQNYQKMRTIVREIWHNFIKTGNPVPKGSPLPAWPPVGVDRSPYMSLGSSSSNIQLQGLLLERICRFWDAMYQLYYRDAVPPPALFTTSSLRHNIKLSASPASSANGSSLLE